jgi:hypothetical protein
MNAHPEAALIVRARAIPISMSSVPLNAPLPWMLRSAASFAAFRFLVYGTVGLASEIFFYNLTRWARLTPLLAWAFRFDWSVDPRLGLEGIWKAPQVALFGQVSLWMFFVYALCSLFLIEPLYRRLKRAPFLARGLVYSLAILGYEWIAGQALKALTGMSIWIYADPWAINGTTSLALLPVWIGTGLVAEALYRGMAVLAPLVVTASAPTTEIRASSASGVIPAAETVETLDGE